MENKSKFNDLIEVMCDICKQPFKRKRFQVEANIRRGRRNMCSVSCKYKNGGQLGWLTQQSDDFSPFRYMATAIRKRCDYSPSKKGDLTYLDIKNKWDEQKGLCNYTGLTMRLKSDDMSNKLFQASVDRIDSSKPYTKGNIEIVCLGINYMKNKFTKEETLQFLRAIRQE